MSPETEWVIRKQYNRRHGVPAAFWALMLLLGIGSLCVIGYCQRSIQREINQVQADIAHVEHSISNRSHR